MQTSVPTPMSPDNSTKHVSDEVETHMPSAKKKPSSGKDKVSISHYCLCFTHFILLCVSILMFYCYVLCCCF